MQAKLIVDGKEYIYEISEKELEDLNRKYVDKPTGYEKATNEADEVCYVTATGQICILHEGQSPLSSSTIYTNANYYTSKRLAEANSRADNLYRCLRRFAAEHREHPITWNPKGSYAIRYDHYENEILVDYTESFQDYGNIYFNTREIAEKAIEIYRCELIWYFTEYKDSLRDMEKGWSST